MAVWRTWTMVKSQRSVQEQGRLRREGVEVLRHRHQHRHQHECVQGLRSRAKERAGLEQEREEG
jgi:hypothetical protein